MAKWKELPVTDDLKRYQPRAMQSGPGDDPWIHMRKTPTGEWVRLDDVAPLVANLRQEQDALKAKLAEAIRELSAMTAYVRGGEFERLRAENERLRGLMDGCGCWTKRNPDAE
jgi:hypothetical protein